jgi:2-keto-4-pentenoate hydratase
LSSSRTRPKIIGEVEREEKRMTGRADERGAALARARIDRVKLAEYPGAAPATIDEALEVQDAMVACLGDMVVGWKIGCTSAVAQKALGADGPFFGPIIATRCFDGGATVETAPSAMRIVESEVALKLARALGPRDEDYDVTEVMAAVGSVHPAIELVNRRAPGGLVEGLTWNIADCGVNDAFILGPGAADIAAIDFSGLVATVEVNGSPRSSGTGSSALGGADRALTWLVNEFRRRGRTLAAGQVVTTGLITEIFTADPGDRVESTFEGIGKVSVVIA